MTATLTIADFLLARIAEDEAAARAAISATGAAEWAPKRWLVVADDEFEVADASVPSADHIARHDPARVLAECATKRRVIEWCSERTKVELPVRIKDAGRPRRESDFVDGDWAHPADTVALRHLAATYAAHPDYRAEWNVQ